jgi:hypothetical protein
MEKGRAAAGARQDGNELQTYAPNLPTGEGQGISITKEIVNE